MSRGRYGRAGGYYDHIYSHKDYRGESEKIIELTKALCPQARWVLDVGCGTGGHLRHLAELYQVEGIDLSKILVREARKKLPDLSIRRANMIRFRMSRSYDVVLCLFSSIGYVRTKKNLDKAVRCMANHLLPGGILLVEPWFSELTWRPKGVYASFVDEEDLKLSRISTNRKVRNLSIITMHFLVGTRRGVRGFQEVHKMGLFTEEEMREAFQKAGLEVEYREEGITGRGLYIGRRLGD